MDAGGMGGMGGEQFIIIIRSIKSNKTPKVDMQVMISQSPRRISVVGIHLNLTQWNQFIFHARILTVMRDNFLEEASYTDKYNYRYCTLLESGLPQSVSYESGYCKHWFLWEVKKEHSSAALPAAPFLDPASEVIRRNYGSQFRPLLLNCLLPWRGHVPWETSNNCVR